MISTGWIIAARDKKIFEQILTRVWQVDLLSRVGKLLFSYHKR